MKEITYAQAINEALREEMARDPSIFLMGEDIGVYGGIFKVTQGLLEEFGEDRVRDTPISEAAIVGAGVGAALTGMRPVVELMFMDFATIAMDQIVNQAAKLRYMSGGQASVPLVIRTAAGAGRASAAQHSQSLEAWFVHVPGIKVVMPSTPYDAKGLLKTCLRGSDPVLFIEHKFLYREKGPVPDEDYQIPLGVADVKRPGRHATVVATSLMVKKSLEAAEQLAAEGIEVEVVDPRTLKPLDIDTIAASVRKTGRLLVVHEACKTGGVAGEIIASVLEECFDYLDAPPARVCGEDVPIPFAPELEQRAVPDVPRIKAGVYRLLGLNVA